MQYSRKSISLIDRLLNIYLRKRLALGYSLNTLLSRLVPEKITNMTVSLIGKLIWSTKIARFYLIGALNTLFGYCVFSAFLLFGFGNSISLLIATCSGIIFNFKTIGHLVFENKNNRVVGKFIALYILLYFINLILMNQINFLVDNLFISGAVSMLICSALSYLVNNYYIFRKVVNC